MERLLIGANLGIWSTRNKFLSPSFGITLKARDKLVCCSKKQLDCL